MNIIKRVIDAKRWPEHTLVSSEDANSALDYIKEAVMTYVTEVEQALYAPRKTVLKAKEQRIAELKTKTARIIHQDNKTISALTQRIAELEAQVPRDVVPETGSCECGGYVLDVLGDRFAYCPDCGAKLDWSEA